MQSQYIKGQEDVEEKSTSNYEGVILHQLSLIKYPIKISLEMLGKKCAILIIIDIDFLKVTHFNRLLDSIWSIMLLLD